MKWVTWNSRSSPGSSGLPRDHVHQFPANFRLLDRHFPGVYPRMFVSGDGEFLTDARGHRVLDAGNHFGACAVGHSRQEVVEAIAGQAAVLEFSSLEAGASHHRVNACAARLADIVPVDDPLFSFTCSGSGANDVAIKVARGFHRRKG
jgi:4-aminobutyrate aminotransferase-like enzyme